MIPHVTNELKYNQGDHMSGKQDGYFHGYFPGYFPGYSINRMVTSFSFLAR